MSGFLRTALLNELRTHFPRWTYGLQLLLSSLVTVAVYYFTSRALAENLSQKYNWYGLDYFEFLIVGELGLMLHLSALDGMTRALRFSHVSGFLDDILTQDARPYLRLSELGTALQFKDSVQWLVMAFLAATVFGFHVEMARASKALLLGLAAWPAFFLIGQILGTVILLTGRGAGVVGQFLFLLAVLSGTYFPMDVFPAWLRDGIIWHLPTTKLLHNMREIVANDLPWAALGPILFYFTVLGLILMLVARFCVIQARAYRLRRSDWIMPLR